MRTVVAALLGLTIWGAALANAQVRDVHVRWSTVKSEHFAVHYAQPLALVARRTLAVLEEAHRRLTPLLGPAPTSRTHVLLTDTAESANGSATSLPYNVIRLFVTAPDDLSPLADYDDWLTGLITHEYAHIVHLDNIGGIPAVINKVFGKIYAPNLATPRWLIEGIATHTESVETSGGRLRSSIFEMYMRTEILEGNELSIDQVSNGIDEWPHGNVAYLYGSRFIDYIATTYGRDKIEEFATLYGRTAITYGLNRTIKRVVGKTFTELYDEWIEHARQKYLALKKRIESKGLSKARKLTHTGETIRAPRFIGDDTLVYYISDGRSDAQLRTLELSTGHTKELTRARGEAYATQHPNGDIYFESTHGLKNIYRYFDLFVLKNGKRRPNRLTRGMRARHPDISPDGRSIVFTQNDSGTRHLVLASIDNIEETRQILYKSQRFEQIYTPRFSPDGKRISFSAWRSGGYRDIFVVDVESRQLVQLTHDRAFDSGPAWSSDGKSLYFSSDRTGIANIFRYELAEGTMMQLTNVVSGAFHPAPSPDGKRLVYIGYTSRGFDLFEIALNEQTPKTANAYVDRRPPPSDTSSHAFAISRRYIPASTLYPRTYSLDLIEDGFGQQLGISVNGSDVVGHHSYDTRLGVSLEKGYIDIRGRYTYHRSPIPITLSLGRSVSPRGGLRVADRRRTWIAKIVSGSISASYPILHRLSTQRLSVGYAFTHVGKRKKFGGVLDPNTSPPTFPFTGYVTEGRLSWAYSDVRRRLYDMSQSAGRALALSLAFSAPALGNDFRAYRFSWSVRRFIEMPWLNHHILAFRYGGGISGSSLGERTVFSAGGFSDVSFVDALINNTSLGGQALRGYSPFARLGSQRHLLQMEYRFPIARIQRGPQTLPLYANRVYGNAFVDWGDAFFGKIDLKNFAVGVGAELFIDFTVGYYLPYTLRTGIAYGLSEGGRLQYYTHFGVPF